MEFNPYIYPYPWNSGSLREEQFQSTSYLNVEHTLAAVFFGIILIGVSLYLKRKSKSRSNENSLAPYLDRSESGRVGKIERFSHYVARQLGFKDEIECPELMKLAYEYLKRSKECDEKMYEYLGKEANAEELYVKLVEEFERCILGYFSFHWRQTPLMISLVLSVNSDQKKLKKTDVKLSEQRQKMAATSHTMVKRIAGTTFLPIWVNPGSQSSTSEFVPARADNTSLSDLV